MDASADPVRTAFVLGGGGGPLGAHEVGMLGALAQREIVPDLVLGTSVGAINGAAFAADPTAEGVERLTAMWTEMQHGDVFSGSLLGRVATLARMPSPCSPASRCGSRAGSAPAAAPSGSSGGTTR